ncbi:hypothetical protein [Parasitella parasitica]|uniref:Tc1-like transposase DDE domain-containing protein n=1 Tax=Parasitella parasitica TaxID=35722 RepID=A0A0B7N3K0_9FUNG|nr:hypothetical protein [Parasitella parasitica]
MSVRAAALQLQIKPRTAQYWVQQDQKEPKDQIVKNVGGTFTVLDEITASLMEQFANLDIKKSALHDFMTNPEKIEERHAWVTKWLQTDMDYLSNCVFVDEAAFHINMKRAETRAMTTTILGAISPFGVVKRFGATSKGNGSIQTRKTAGSSRTVDKATSKRGTVTGHYFNFLSSTMDVLDRHEMFKDNYIVMDNAPIHQHENIRKHIETRGYRCIYLPPYSPELNPIEQCWFICKSKLKREPLLEEETLTIRIQMACNQILIGKYYIAKFDNCLNRRPI